MSEWTAARDFVVATLEATLPATVPVFGRMRRTDDPGVAANLFNDSSSGRLNPWFVTRVQASTVYRLDYATRDHVAAVHGFMAFVDGTDEANSEDDFQGQIDAVLAGMWARRGSSAAYGVTVAKPPEAGSIDIGNAAWLGGAMCHHVEIRWPLSRTASRGNA